ncbi:MAG: GTP-binding protein [Thiomargarita sp.]|nr:GTP-binding protein [Thiomargarita sp.]
MENLLLENSHKLLPIHIISGFLGSGKTTLLNQLIQQPNMQDTVVIVNEFGEVSIDHLLIETSTEDIMILEGGCVCCSIRSDLLTTLEDLFNKRLKQEMPSFSQVLIETTGLADPVPIIRTLMDDDYVSRHFRLGTIITTVDAVYGNQQLKEFDESVKQAVLANHIILTKIDLVATDIIQELKQRLHRINPSASIQEINLKQNFIDSSKIFETSHYHIETQQFDMQRWLQADIYIKHEKQAVLNQSSHHHHDSYIKTFCIEYHQPLHWITLEHWIRQLTRLRGKDLLRVKGIAYTYETDLPVVIQGVQHIFQAPTTLNSWATKERLSQIVFITRNINKDTVERLLHTLINSKNSIDVCQAALILL